MDARTTFERERDKLVAEISESLGRLLTNVNALNRNVEAANLVGKQFDHPHTLWSKFDAVMRLPANAGLAASSSDPAHRDILSSSAANPPADDAPTAGTVLGAAGTAGAGMGGEGIVGEDETARLPPGVAPGGGKSIFGSSAGAGAGAGR